MIDIDDICKMYRTSHTDREIVSIIATVHCLPAQEVRKILIDRGLMSEGGQYIEPIRITGKEGSNMTQFTWSQENIARLWALQDEGMSRTEIAGALGCTDSALRNAITRFPNPNKKRKEAIRIPKDATLPAPAPAIKAPENAAAPPPAAILSKEKEKQSPLLNVLVHDAAELCKYIWETFEQQEDFDTYNLGRLQEKLALAVQLMELKV